MKKKIGPLPLWSWIVIVGGTIGIYLLHKRSSSSTAATSGTTTASQVDPNNPLGLTYAQEQADQANGVDPMTGQSYASEQASADANLGANNGGGGTTTSTGADYSGELSTIDADLGVVSSQLSTLGSGGLMDNSTPVQTFAGEVNDVGAGITALGALQKILAPTPATAKPKPKQHALTAKGATRLRSGPTKPAAPKGTVVKGLGDGEWEAVPIIKKTTTHAPAKTTTKKTTSAKKVVVSGKKK